MWCPQSSVDDDYISDINFNILPPWERLKSFARCEHDPSSSNTDEGDGEVGKSILRGDVSGSDSDSSPWWAYTDKVNLAEPETASWDERYMPNDEARKMNVGDDDYVNDPYEQRLIKSLPWKGTDEQPTPRPKRPLRVSAPYFTVSDCDSELELDSDQEFDTLLPAPPNSLQSTTGDLISNDSIFHSY